jgi:ribosome-binding protein aMBF1 (putative translation factor)
MNHQDWTPVVVNKSKPISTNKVNKKPLGDSDEIEKTNNISIDNRLIIQQARLAHKLTQKQLAQKINVDEKTIKNYENGNIVPEHRLMCKLENILKISLNKKKKQ